MNHENQTVLITGASSGIGAQTAVRFAKEGYELLLFGRDEARLKNVKDLCQKQSLKQKTEILAFDLVDINNYTDEILKKIDELTTPTILINNAGLFHFSLLEETHDDVWLKQFQVNLLSAVQLTKTVWPIFKKNKKGSIINIASTLGVKPSVGTGAYSAIKAAMINWTMTLAQEGGAHNIRANCICPGIVDTPIHAFHTLDLNEKQKATQHLIKLQLLNFIGSPTDIAETIYFLASDLSKWTTGSIINVDGGINIK